MHWRRKWQPTPVFLPGEAHGQRSLAGYSPCGHEELDMTERLHFTSRHRQARLQNKGLSRASWLWTGPSPTEDRQARAARARRGQLWTQRGIIYQLQAGFVANQDFLGFWMVDIHREGRSQRSAPQKRYMAHLRRCTGCTPRKPSSRDGEGDKLQQLRSPSTWSSELLGPGKATKCRPNRFCAFVEYVST